MNIYRFEPNPDGYERFGFVIIIARTYQQAIELHDQYSNNMFKPKLVRVKPDNHPTPGKFFVLTEKIPTNTSQKPRVAYSKTRGAYFLFVDDLPNGHMILQCEVCAHQYESGSGSACPECNSELHYPPGVDW